jgi:hypothetical protein
VTKGKMSAGQYEKALAALGLDHEQATELLDIDYRTSTRWVYGERDVPGPAANFLRYLVATGTSGADAIKVIKQKG